MTLAFVVGLACGFIGSIPIAGPAAALVVERTLAKHSGAALGIGLGTAVAEAGYAVLAFLGTTVALERFTWLLPVSRVLGAAILVGLGLYLALAKRRRGKDAPGGSRKRDGLWLGFVITIVNPTLIVTWSAVVTILHSWGFLRIAPLDALPFGLGVGAGVAGWFVVLVELLRLLHKKLEESTLDKIVRVMGWLMVAGGVGLGVKLAIMGFASR